MAAWMVVTGAVEVEVLVAWLTNMEQALTTIDAGYLVRTAGVDRARLLMLAVVVVVRRTVLVARGVTTVVGVTVARSALYPRAEEQKGWRVAY